MRRTKEWWSVLNKSERVWLVSAEGSKSSSYGGGGYLPDDCSECDVCGWPTLGAWWCEGCAQEWHRIIHKAERMIIRLRAVQLMIDIEAMGIQPPTRKQAVKIARQHMCEWTGERYGRVYDWGISIAYHPLKPASELMIFGGK